jgi:hypothetical protein
LGERWEALLDEIAFVAEQLDDQLVDEVATGTPAVLIGAPATGPRDY